MKELIQITRDFDEDRPVMAQNNGKPERLFELLDEEVQELKQAEGENIGRELADILWDVFKIAIHHDIDLVMEFREKAARNHLKYPAHLFQEGNYWKKKAQAKAQWEWDKGEEWFYEGAD